MTRSNTEVATLVLLLCGTIVLVLQVAYELGIVKRPGVVNSERLALNHGQPKHCGINV